MEETEFNTLTEATLKRIELSLEACDGLECEVQPGGVLEVEFENGSKIVINRHAAAQEIWVAARSGGFHFRHENQRWVGTRDGIELFAALNRLLSDQAGTPIELD